MVTNTSIENKQNNFWGSKPEAAKQDFFTNRKESDVKPSAKENFNLNNNNTSKERKSESENKMDDDNDFQNELCQLNLSVVKFIQKHIDENPCIDLKPVFADYEKHFKDLEAKHKNATGKSIVVEAKPAKEKSSSISFKTPDNNSTPIISSAAKPPSFSTMFKSSTPIQPNLFGAGIYFLHNTTVEIILF